MHYDLYVAWFPRDPHLSRICPPGSCRVRASHTAARRRGGEAQVPVWLRFSNGSVATACNCGREDTYFSYTYSFSCR